MYLSVSILINVTVLILPSVILIINTLLQEIYKKLKQKIKKTFNKRSKLYKTLNKALIEIITALGKSIEAMTLKTKYTTSNFRPWKETVLARVKEKIRIKRKIKHKQTKPVLCDPDVKKHLEELHRKFAFVTIDKASNNFAFTYRKYYISKLLAEVSPNKNKNSKSTYSQTQKSKEELIKANIKYCKKSDLKVTEQDKTLPIMCWLPKCMTPIGAKFIVASKTAVLSLCLMSLHVLKSFGL